MREMGSPKEMSLKDNLHGLKLEEIYSLGLFLLNCSMQYFILAAPLVILSGLFLSSVFSNTSLFIDPDNSR